MMPADLDAAATVVLSWLLTYAVHSTILLGLAALAARRLADEHAWLDLIWKTALIAPLLTASLPLDLIAVPIRGPWTVPGVTVSGPQISAPASVAIAGPATSSGMTRGRATSPAVERTATKDERIVPITRQLTWLQQIVRSWPSIAVAMWLIIAIATLGRYGVRLRRVYRLLGSGLSVTSANLLDTIEALRRSAGQRRPVRLKTNAICPVPLALAGRQIVLPDRLLDELDREEQHAALAHEMAHVVRRDPEWRIAADVVERVFFFQPLNRLARGRLCDAAEFLCDEWAMRQGQSSMALARCLSAVASWWSQAGVERRILAEGAGKLPAGVSAMARSDSALVRRVTRILNDRAPARRLPLPWVAIPVTLVAILAPRVAATQLPAPVSVTPAAVAVTDLEQRTEQRAEQRTWTAADIAAARAQLRVYRPARPDDALEERWRQALADVARQRLSSFWIGYTFNTPTHAGDVMVSDTRDGSFVFSDGRVFAQGPPLSALFGPSAVPLDGGTVAVLLHYRGARADAIDRASYRSIQLGFDFGRTPVFWLGAAPEAQSFERVQSLFNQTRTEKIQVLLIELASLHSNSDVVLPFLTRLVDPSSWPPAIRREGAEGFDHHHDPRSVDVLLRVARTDPDSSVRAEAAETIGEVQVPQSIPALNDLVSGSSDPDVRREAAEAFADQPVERALPAIERIIETSADENVLTEVVEALGELDDPRALPLLVQTANTHSNRRAQREAVETLGDREDADAIAALERMARDHQHEEVQVQAIETIADRSGASLHPVVLELAVSGGTARIRRAALESIGEAVTEIADEAALDRAQQALERAIFDDPDPAVRVDALEALAELPGERALRALRDVIARHPDARVRREAEEQVRERRR